MRLHGAAKRRVPLVLVLADGARVAGRVVEAGITFAVVGSPDGQRTRVELRHVVEVHRRDGRLFWPPRESHHASEGGTP
jgi:hypothetical protein